MGVRDIFVHKLDTAGNFIWVKTMGGTAQDNGRGITCDGKGNVYTGGVFTRTTDFDPSNRTVNLTSKGSWDIFVQKLDSAGRFKWVRRVGETVNDRCQAITSDKYGNIYSSGWYNDTADFDPSSGVHLLKPNGSSDLYVQKLDSSGNFKWAMSTGGNATEYGQAISVDGFGAIYTTGSFESTVDFNPDTGRLNITSVGRKDFYIQKLSEPLPYSASIAETAAVKCFGDSSGALKVSVVSGQAKYSYYWSNGVIDTNSSSASSSISKLRAGTYSVTVVDGNNDTISTKYVLGQPSLVTNSSTHSSCGIFYWPVSGKFYNRSGVYVERLSTSTGCDSIVSIVLTVNHRSEDSTTINTCDEYTWPANNKTYKTSGVYADTIVNTKGCDSLVYLLLSIRKSTVSSESQTSCDSYTWAANGNRYSQSGQYNTTKRNGAGCDSLMTLNLTINKSSSTTIPQSACDEYHWPTNGMTYYRSGNYVETLSNVLGCDSVVSLNLTINTLDSSVTVKDPEITANVMGANYQWLSCDHDYAPIAGQKSRKMIAPANGKYAVEVKANGCVDTSACVTIATVGLSGLRNASTILLYPNPNEGIVNVELGEWRQVNISVYDVEGKMVYHEEDINERKHQFQLDVPAGVYVVELESSAGKQSMKLVKR